MPNHVIDDLLDMEEEELFYQLLQASSRSPEPTTSAGLRAVIVPNCIDGHT
jgi:hypothetical protein